LDIKGPNVIKGIHLEGLRVVGKPGSMAKKYYEQGADEILYMDIVASLYGRDNLVEIVRQASQEIFVPLTVGGGVRKLDDIKMLLRAGADKTAINTAATKTPELITKGAQMFGSQCIVVSIEAKSTGQGKWEAYTDNGREKTGLDAVQWAIRVEELGAGEILLTSIDKEGTMKGFDLDLVSAVSSSVSIPVIACGGAGTAEDVVKCVKQAKPDAIALASILHYNKTTVGELKSSMREAGIGVRVDYE
jgi:cyclase